MVRLTNFAQGQYMPILVLLQFLLITNVQSIFISLTLATLIPSVDDHSMTEIQNLVDELQHEDDQKKENEGGGGADDPDAEGKNNSGENGGSGDNSDAKSALALFDKLQAKED